MVDAEVKLVQVKELGFSIKSDTPTGEICVRGPCLAQGYHEDSNLTQETTLRIF